MAFNINIGGVRGGATVKSGTFFLSSCSEEVGHDFRGMQVELSRAMGKALFLLTQWVDLGCGGVH